MEQTRIRPMVEGGLLAAIAVMFAILFAYVPIIGQLAILVWPVPIILLGVRRGYKWSILATVTAGVVMISLLPPLTALSIVMVLGLPSIVLGHAFRQKFSPSKTILWGTGASFISIVALLTFCLLFLGQNILDDALTMEKQWMEQSLEIARDLGTDVDKLAKAESASQFSLSIMKTIMPAYVVLLALLLTGIYFWTAKLVLKRLGYHINSFPAFKLWDIPQWSTGVFAFAGVMIYWGYSRDIALLYQVGVNVLFLSGLFLLVQGLAVFNYFAEKYNLSRMIWGIILVLMLINLAYLISTIVVGVIDTFVDYRRLRSPQKNE